eukprot:3055079-Amphidinium_carterae.1
MPKNGKPEKWETGVFEENSFTLRAFFCSLMCAQVTANVAKFSTAGWRAISTRSGGRGNRILSWLESLDLVLAS